MYIIKIIHNGLNYIIRDKRINYKYNSIKNYFKLKVCFNHVLTFPC